MDLAAVPSRFARSNSRRAALLGVIAIHLTFFGVWRVASEHHARRQAAVEAAHPPAASRVEVRLLPARAPAGSTRPAPEGASMGAARRAAALITARAPEPTRAAAPLEAHAGAGAGTGAAARPAPPVRNAPAGTDLPTSSDTAAAPMQDAASQPPRALDLTLPPGFATAPGARHPAIDDPRANTLRAAPGERMAATLGSDNRVVVEEFGNGRRRIRQGTSCTIVQPTRMKELFAFDDAAQRAPSLGGRCP